jgi:hypothetical protein
MRRFGISARIDSTASADAFRHWRGRFIQPPVQKHALQKSWRIIYQLSHTLRIFDGLSIGIVRLRLQRLFTVLGRVAKPVWSLNQLTPPLIIRIRRG